jgi:hypothetical protein
MMKTLTNAPIEGMYMDLAISATASQSWGARPMNVVAAKQLGFVPQPNLID